ncbi:MAG: SHOCT domain-containing protein [Anaerolineales bacterium]|jgi:putative membrane protein
MKRKTMILVAAMMLVAGLMFAGSVSAQDEGKSLKDVVAEIRKSQNLQDDQSIDCSLVTDKQYEEVGEAWMDVMVPNAQRHEMMDRMMGGEGSESLANAHRVMGARYLGCYDGDWPGPTMGFGLGGYGMGGYGMGRYGGGMMHGYGYNNGGWWWGGWWWWIVVIIVIGGIIWMVVAVSGSAKQRARHGTAAMEILKNRYARGEISKEEFERMKKDIS